MDILRTLRSILSPEITPANRARPAVPVGENQAGHRTFAQTLEEAALDDPSIAPFGVQAPKPGNRPPPNLPLAWPGASEPTTAPHSANGALINRDDRQEPTTDLPIDTLHIEVRDTLKSIITQERETLEHPEVLPPPADDPVTNPDGPDVASRDRPPVNL